MVGFEFLAEALDKFSDAPVINIIVVGIEMLDDGVVVDYLTSILEEEFK